MNFKKPNFKKNIINISASFANFLGCKNENFTNKIIDKELKNNNYKNIVFIVLDGLGAYPLKQNLSADSFLRQNVKQKLTSVFPSTTTNATISLISNSTPLKHGWLSWSVYFEEINKSLDLFTSNDSYTKDQHNPNFLKQRIPFEGYYKTARSDYNVYKVVPPFWVDNLGNKNRYNYETDDQMFEMLTSVCKLDGKKFIYSYNPEPDRTMHKTGVLSLESKNIIEYFNNKIEKLSKEVKDTLIVITADHGHSDVNGFIDLYKDQKLYNMLQTKPYLESKAACFMVKNEYLKQFKKHFNKNYKKEFKLYSSKKLISKNYFGEKTENAKILGHYIALSKNNKMLLFSENHLKFKGQHTGLGKQDMLVPLIIIKT